MGFFDKIKEFGLDPTSIQNCLKNIGVDINRYTAEALNFSDDLFATLKNIGEIGKTASRQDKMLLLSNFGSAIKGKPVY